uniref:Glutamic acid-rich protein-like n=1 Tax=Tanacetum cinerariifolium TaxID=118510 RepID=A0A699IZY1_TANCI|nr:glutamic acid-rich protein-like [Tanacetum cinerariifolium]
MGYEKPPPKMTFYKAFFSTQWKFLVHTLVQCISAKRTAWNEFSCSMASAVICLDTGRKFNFSKYIFGSMAQPTKTSKSSMTLLNTLMEKCATLSQKVVALEQDKIAQSLEILKLKNRVKKLKRKRRSKSSGLKRLRKGRKDDYNAAANEVSVVEPTVFDDEEVTMTMAQTLINMKAEKARILDEQMAKRLHEEEENIDWNVVAEQIQEKDLDNIKKYQSLKRKPISIAQARKNMIIYLKNMAGYKIKHFRGMTYDKESFKKLKAVEALGSHSTLDTPTDDPKEMSEEDVKNMLEIVPVSEFKVEALQLQADEDYEMAKDLVMKIFMEANKPKSRSLDISSK